jgi:hypothetical protein
MRGNAKKLKKEGNPNKQVNKTKQTNKSFKVINRER